MDNRLLWDDHHPADAISDYVRYEVLLLEFYAALLITFLSRIGPKCLRMRSL